jgi:hypothetical protein
VVIARAVHVLVRQTYWSISVKVQRGGTGEEMGDRVWMEELEEGEAFGWASGTTRVVGGGVVFDDSC